MPPLLAAGFYEINDHYNYCGKYSHCILTIFSTEKKCNHIVKNTYKVKSEVSDYCNTKSSCNLFEYIHPFHLTMIIAGSVHMVKKIIAVATAILMLCCMVPLAAFADDVLDTCPKCGERTYETWQDFSTSVPDLGFPISIKRRHCTSCQYTYYDWNCMGYTGYKEFDSGSGNLIVDYLKESVLRPVARRSNSPTQPATT